nr:immunoglobulin light chain junction region [Macaca mulatta]MOV76555.1 immunoglobulin light chain junction region [Macaca mulatta]MOV76628.1 immunoglobulin light chain junction region [Macaca mulatta]MOW08472.1 immunoglobulin light chain junction region [Macaca mulatta]MOW10336.1 immunoglobulin light chain junction region [Macaca mulatta]
CHNGFGFPLTF